MVCVFDTNLCVFYNPKTNSQEIFVTNNTAVGLQRFRNKLLFNFLNDQLPIGKKTFVTLTVDEQHYQECFQQISGSAHMRKFMTNMRNWMNRHDHQFDYAWRLERGKNATQRLHYHLIVNSDLNSEQVKREFMKKWHYCQWDKLNVDKSFEDINGENLAVIYASKYTSVTVKHNWKSKPDEWDSPNNIRHELHSRLYSTSRRFRMVPDHMWVHFDDELKKWGFPTKNNWEFRGKIGSVDADAVMLPILGEQGAMEFDCKMEGKTKKFPSRISQFGGFIYYKMWGYIKIDIKSFDGYESADDLKRDFRYYVEGNQEINLEQYDQQKLKIFEQINFIRDNLYYRKDLVEQLRCESIARMKSMISSTLAHI